MLHRAWELGATNDMWWMNQSAAFEAWNAAIEESGLTWKYRQVRGGEWNSLENLGHSAFRKQGALPVTTAPPFAGLFSLPVLIWSLF